MAQNGVPVSADLPSDLRNWKSQIRAQWIRVWIAANKVGALLVAVVLHKALDVSAEWVVPTEWSKWLLLLRVSFAAAFSVVYFHFVWEVLAAFVPRFRIRNKKIKEGDIQDADNTEGSQ